MAILEERIATLEANEKSMSEKIDDLTKTVKDGFDELKLKMDGIEKRYVTKESFWPVKTLAYGFAGLLLVGIVGALIGMVIK